jgi:hypothetical protein
MKNLLWIPLASLLASCGAFTVNFKTFEEPLAGERARVRLVEAGDDYVRIRAIPGKNHVDWETPGAGTVFDGWPGWTRYLLIVPTSEGFSGRSLGIPAGSSRQSAAEFYVQAGEPVTLVAYGSELHTGRYHTECTETIIRHKNKPDESTTECKEVAETSSCNVSMSFTPGKNADYEVTYSRQDAWNCRLDWRLIGVQNEARQKGTLTE